MGRGTPHGLALNFTHSFDEGGPLAYWDRILNLSSGGLAMLNIPSKALYKNVGKSQMLARGIKQLSPNQADFP